MNEISYTIPLSQKYFTLPFCKYNRNQPTSLTPESLRYFCISIYLPFQIYHIKEMMQYVIVSDWLSFTTTEINLVRSTYQDKMENALSLSMFLLFPFWYSKIPSCIMSFLLIEYCLAITFGKYGGVIFY